MTYIPEDKSQEGSSVVIFNSKTTNVKETFTATDFLARLITHKIYHVDPLVCPKGSGKMKIIAFIEEEEGLDK